MSTPDKRRGGGNGINSNTANGPVHVIRSISGSATTPTRNSINSLASASTSSTTTNNNSNNNSIIAPPPRVQLTRASSPSPSSGTTDTSQRSNNTSSSLRSSSPSAGSSSSRRSSTAAAVTNLASANAAITTANQILLRDKDAKISALERELSVMEGEFTKELDRLSSKESETATFWQGKAATLAHAVASSDAQISILEAQLQSQQNALDSVRDALKQRDDEVRALQSQVKGLKDWVSTSTRAVGNAQTSDEVFAEAAARLGNGLQNWVISNFRKAKIDLTLASEEQLAEVVRLVPLCAELAEIAKMQLLQAIVAQILVRDVFRVYYFGLSAVQETQLCEAQKVVESVGGRVAVNQWRSVTLTLCRNSSTKDLRENAIDNINSITHRIITILDAITTRQADTANNNTTITTTTTTTRESTLRAIIEAAVDLSRNMHIQKAEFDTVIPEILPHHRVLFDPWLMEDIGSEDEESLLQREICAVTFPAITKRGDQNGDHVHLTNVISKARVLCSP